MKKIAIVAPREAPDDTPKIYGSANGFCTIACITTPLIAKPAPANITNNIRGILINQIISFSIPCPLSVNEKLLYLYEFDLENEFEVDLDTGKVTEIK